LFGGLFVLWGAGFFVIAPIAENRISGLCGGAVYVKSGYFRGVGGIRLKGVVLAEDDKGLVEAPVFRFDEINITFSPWKLLKGKFEVNSIRLSDFLFDATYCGNDRWNFSSFSIQRSAAVSQKIPFIEIRNGTMRLSRLKEDHLGVITTISLNGQVAAQTSENEYSFLLSTDGRFGFAGSTLQGLLKIGESGQKSRFSASGKIQMPKAKIFENAWNLDNIRLECAFDANGVILNRCAFTMGEGQVDIQGAIQDDAENRQELNLEVNINNLFLSDYYKQNAIVYSEPVLELLDPGLRRFLNHYRPTGTGDVKLAMQGYLDDLSATVLNGTITCRDISITPEKFPYRMENLKGDIELTGRDLKLNELKAGHDGVELLINASIENIGSNAEITLQMTSPNMRFDPDLYYALNDSAKKAWLAFSPSGETAIDYQFNRTADGQKTFSLEMGLKNADLVYEHFPYPLKNLTGTISMDSDRVELKNLVSHFGDSQKITDDNRKITLDGIVFRQDCSKQDSIIYIKAYQIPVDKELINAMPPSQKEFFDKLDIDADAAAEVEVFPNLEEERFWDYSVNVIVDGNHLVYSDFPVQMNDIHLTAKIQKEQIELERFEGRTSGGKVLMSGNLLPKGADALSPGVSLNLNLEAFNFNETFWEEAGKALREHVGKLRVDGRMNVTGRLTRNMPQENDMSTDLTIQCSNNPIRWDHTQLGQAEGQICLRDDQVVFEEFSLNDVPLESVPEELLKGKLKSIYSRFQPHGNVDLRAEHGTVRIAEDGLKELDVEGQVAMRNVATGPEEVISGVMGEIGGHLSYDHQKNIWHTRVSYDVGHIKYRYWQASNLQGNLVYDPNTQNLESDEFVADFYGGKMIGHFVVDLNEEESTGYKMGLSVNEVDVPQLLAARRQQAFENVSQGLVNGMLNLEGDLRLPSQSKGKVVADIMNMKLGKQSLLGKILTAVQFKQPDEYVFSEIQSSAFIRGPELIIENLRMVGKPLVFRGKGKIDLGQKQIEMDLVAFDRLLGTEDTILDLLARGIGSAVWKVEVRGALDDPKVDAVFLSVLKQPLELFRKKE